MYGILKIGDEKVMSEMVSSLFKNLPIRYKLYFSFGALMLLMLAVVSFSYLGNYRAKVSINRTANSHAPTALASVQAQSNLLTMLGSMQGYLALGDKTYRRNYEQTEIKFSEDLDKLSQLSQDWADEENIHRLTELQVAFTAWANLPERLFELRDDQLKREPALRLLVEDGNVHILLISRDISLMISEQAKREPSADNMALLEVMSNYQSSFFSMISGLRGYVTSQRDIFKTEYQSNKFLNDNAWDVLSSSRAKMTESQKNALDNIATHQEIFAKLPDEMFHIIDNNQSRQDLYLFRNEAIPLAEDMMILLEEMTSSHQALLQTDLHHGLIELVSAQRNMFISSILATLLAMILIYVFQTIIGGPIQRLTQVIELVYKGDLTVSVPIESQDEIGILAQTFSRMLEQLNEMINHLNKQNYHLETLNETASGLFNRLELTDLLEGILTRIGMLLNAPNIYIQLLDTKKNILEVKVGLEAFKHIQKLKIDFDNESLQKVFNDDTITIVDGYNDLIEYLPSENSRHIRSIIAVPLRFGSEVIGIIGVGHRGNLTEQIKQEEIEILNRFARLTVLTLDNDRLYNALQQELAERKLAEALLREANRSLKELTDRLQFELALAHEIQRSLLPPPTPIWKNLDVMCYTIAAREVGGDFYTYHIFDDDHFAIAIGDVSGKGMPAAMLVGVSLASFQLVIGKDSSPARLLTNLDKAIVPFTKSINYNCALVYAEIHNNILCVANAGCITPIIRRADDTTVEWIDVGGVPLGIGLSSEFGYNEVTQELSRGDLVIFVSDGVVEACNIHKELFGFDRLEETIQNAPSTGAAIMLEYIEQEVAKFVDGCEAHDDLTIVVLQMR